MRVFLQPFEFSWNRGNKGKNWHKHGVTDEECEETFFDDRKKMLRDMLHSGAEERYLLLGLTKAKRLLFVVFTVRGAKVRVISARDLNKKERKLYYEEEKS